MPARILIQQVGGHAGIVTIVPLVLLGPGRPPLIVARLALETQGVRFIDLDHPPRAGVGTRLGDVVPWLGAQIRSEEPPPYESGEVIISTTDAQRLILHSVVTAVRGNSRPSTPTIITLPKAHRIAHLEFVVDTMITLQSGLPEVGFQFFLEHTDMAPWRAQAPQRAIVVVHKLTREVFNQELQLQLSAVRPPRRKPPSVPTRPPRAHVTPVTVEELPVPGYTFELLSPPAGVDAGGGGGATSGVLRMPSVSEQRTWAHLGTEPEVKLLAKIPASPAGGGTWPPEAFAAWLEAAVDAAIRGTATPDPPTQEQVAREGRMDVPAAAARYRAILEAAGARNIAIAAMFENADVLRADTLLAFTEAVGGFQLGGPHNRGSPRCHTSAKFLFMREGEHTGRPVCEHLRHHGATVFEERAWRSFGDEYRECAAARLKPLNPGLGPPIGNDLG